MIFFQILILQDIDFNMKIKRLRQSMAQQHTAGTYSDHRKAPATCHDPMCSLLALLHVPVAEQSFDVPPGCHRTLSQRQSARNATHVNPGLCTDMTDTYESLCPRQIYPQRDQTEEYGV